MERVFIQEIYCISDLAIVLACCLKMVSSKPTKTSTLVCFTQEIGISRTNSPNNFMWEQLLSSPGSLPQGLSQQECEKQMEKLADQVRVGDMAGFWGPRDTLLMATRNPVNSLTSWGWLVVEIPIFLQVFLNTSRVVQDFWTIINSIIVDIVFWNEKDTMYNFIRWFWRFLNVTNPMPGSNSPLFLPVGSFHRSNDQALLNLPKSVGERIAKAPRRLLVQRSVQGQRLRRGLLRGTTIAFITTGYEGLG